MLLSVLTPTFNCAKTLSATLQTVHELEGFFPHMVEHLIGDAGSTDGSIEIISQYSAQSTWVKSYALAGLNIPETLNKLLFHASGRWIVVLNGDDFFIVKNVVTLLGKIFPEEPSILCGQVSVISFEGALIGYRDCDPSRLDKFMSINHPAMIVDKRLFTKIGNFDETTPVTYDYLWTWRAFRAGTPFIKQELIIASARLGGISQTRAHQGAKEILGSKIKSGVFFVPLMVYILFLSKLFFRKLLPVSLAGLVTQAYRKIKGSIEHY